MDVSLPPPTPTPTPGGFVGVDLLYSLETHKSSSYDVVARPYVVVARPYDGNENKKDDRDEDETSFIIAAAIEAVE